MAVIAQRERGLEIVGERFEAAEVRCALIVVEIGKPDGGGMAVVEEAFGCLRKVGSFDCVIKVLAELQNARIGVIGLLLGHVPAIGEVKGIR